jgi:shikimate dehydrogenase
MSYVDGATRLYAIIGDPVEQVKSPQTLTPRFHALGRNALLVPVHVPSADFDTIVPALMRVGNLDGIIATVPFKSRIMKFCDRILDTGRQVGATNAVRREADGSWTADMFDGRGLIRGLLQRGIEIAGRRALLLGAGGAGSATGFALAEAGAASVTVYEIDGAKAERLAAGIRAAYPKCRTVAGAPSLDGHDMLVNATPVGMPGDKRLPVPFERLDPSLLVCDVIMKPEVTPLLRLAQECGCTAIGGRAMLDGQVDELLKFFGMT